MYERHRQDRRVVTHRATAAAWGLGFVLYPLGSGRTGRAAIVRRWFTKSASTLGVSYDRWFDPSVIATVDTMLANGEIGSALDNLVLARAAAAFSLADTAADLANLVAAAPTRLRLRLERLDLARLLAMAWPEPTTDVVAGADALGTLTTRVRAACGRSTVRIGNTAGPTLVVIDGDANDRDRLAVAASRWIAELFPAAEMLGVVSPGRFLAVVHAHAPKPDPAQLLSVVIKASPGGAMSTVRSQPWPESVDDALTLVAGLAGAARELQPTSSVVVPISAAASVARRAARVATDARAWAAGGVAAAIALAFTITGGTGSHPPVSIPAAQAPPTAVAPVVAGAGAAPASAASATRVRVPASGVTPSGSAGSAAAPAASSPAGGGGGGNDDGVDQKGPSPTPPIITLPIGSPPGLGEIDTRVRKLLLTINQAVGMDVPIVDHP